MLKLFPLFIHVFTCNLQVCSLLFVCCIFFFFFLDMFWSTCKLKWFERRWVFILESLLLILCHFLTLLLLNTTCPVLANSVDPDQLASSEANWSGFALFVINMWISIKKPGSSNLIGWKLEVVNLFSMRRVNVIINKQAGLHSRFQSQLCLVQSNFYGDWSWNHFCSHSPPYADSRRASVSYWQKYCAQVHVLVNCLEA